MSETTTHDAPLTGKCLCGAVSVTLENARTHIDVCHCTMCLVWGGPFAGLSAGGFTADGEANVATHDSSAWAKRAFCRTCGTHLWYNFLPAGSFSFCAGLFDLPESFTITQQIFVDEKPHWYDYAQVSAMKTGDEIIAEAEAMGFAFDKD